MAAGDKIILGGIIDADGNSFKAVVHEQIGVVGKIGGLTLRGSDHDATHVYGTEGIILYKINKKNMTIDGVYDGGLRSNASLAVDENYIYMYTSGDKLLKIQKETMTLVATSDSVGGPISTIRTDGEHVFFSTNGYNIYKYNCSDLSNTGTISPSYGGNIYDFAIDEQYVYVGGSPTSTRVSKYKKSDLTLVAHGPTLSASAVIGVVVGDDYVYYATGGTKEIYQADISTLLTVNKTSLSNTKNINVDNMDYSDGKLYVSYSQKNKVFVYDENLTLVGNSDDLSKVNQLQSSTQLLADDENIYVSITPELSFYKLTNNYELQGFEKVVLP